MKHITAPATSFLLHAQAAAAELGAPIAVAYLGAEAGRAPYLLFDPANPPALATAATLLGFMDPRAGFLEVAS